MGNAMNEIETPSTHNFHSIDNGNYQVVVGRQNDWELINNKEYTDVDTSDHEVILFDSKSNSTLNDIEIIDNLTTLTEIQNEKNEKPESPEIPKNEEPEIYNEKVSNRTMIFMRMSNIYEC
jgi:hypothetical protein